MLAFFFSYSGFGSLVSGHSGLAFNLPDKHLLPMSAGPRCQAHQVDAIGEVQQLAELQAFGQLTPQLKPAIQIEYFKDLAISFLAEVYVKCSAVSVYFYVEPFRAIVYAGTCFGFEAHSAFVKKIKQTVL